MSRRIKRTLSAADRDRKARTGGRDGERAKAHRAPDHRGGGKPQRFSDKRHEARDDVRRERRVSFGAEAPKAQLKAEPPQLPTKVQTVVVTRDEDNMRVD